MPQFLIVIEKAENNYSAYSPDLTGCVATGLRDVHRGIGAQQVALWLPAECRGIRPVDVRCCPTRALGLARGGADRRRPDAEGAEAQFRATRFRD